MCLLKVNLYNSKTTYFNRTDDAQLIFDSDYFEFVGLALSEEYFAEAKKERKRFDRIRKEPFKV